MSHRRPGRRRRGPAAARPEADGDAARRRGGLHGRGCGEPAEQDATDPAADEDPCRGGARRRAPARLSSHPRGVRDRDRSGRCGEGAARGRALGESVLLRARDAGGDGPGHLSAALCGRGDRRPGRRNAA